jgi:2-amino-4-hydroxy-6-hydroxymethyldihydropteridine diphosphokinase
MAFRVFVGLGANLNGRLRNLRLALSSLRPTVELVAVSPLYQTDPWGVTNQPAFLNAVCEVVTELAPDALLDHLKQIERSLGRLPGPRWGARAIDLDILLYDHLIVDSPSLQIPHPRLAEREFVLRPLADLDPSRVVPGLGRTVQELLIAVAGQGVRMVRPSGWEHGDEAEEPNEGL